MKVQYYNKMAFKSYELKLDSFRRLGEPEFSAVKNVLCSEEMTSAFPRISKGVRLTIGLNSQNTNIVDVLIKKGEIQNSIPILVGSLYKTVQGFNFLSFLEGRISDFKMSIKGCKVKI